VGKVSRKVGHVRTLWTPVSCTETRYNKSSSFLIYILARFITLRGYQFNNLRKLTAKYEPKSLRYIVYQTTQNLAFELGGTPSKRGKIAAKYKEFFRKPVPWTLDSLTYKQYSTFSKNKLTLATNSTESKSNPPAKYLYPSLGGGDTGNYPTRFAKWLWDRGYASKNQYPYANFANKEFIKKRDGFRVQPYVYADTQRALSKTRNQKPHRNIDGPKIQDGRVFAKKEPFGGKKKRYEPGIYRVKTNFPNGENYIKPLFLFGPRHSVPTKGNFYALVIKEARGVLPELFRKNIEKYGRGY